MTNKFILENKISSIKKYLKILDDYKDLSREKITNDVNTKGAVERYLYLATQATIDLAEAIISYKNYRKPATFSESFTILAEEKIIDKILEEKLTKMVGFRNALAHGYEKIDYEVVYDSLQNGPKDIGGFINIVEDLYS
ncbi:hypothetical protein A2630_03400 [Candidatus Woesebacteria bacterium RIFCSPHIGHO2_01_FULL_44_10]|uniref:DUF86 domain-containing protein n=1 Tax=Candidatus Woesebacteria bacterium RIFCSPLOWO2_01_FULL_44_14 TaxID=1802525 RepID=A0A1F8BZY1_9BACT|nr:MAG: hypothetical protein A2630_03400 [Candidatus Woesebacteria bacterium RIFCSPHIGHO2_01_FULL_44_10]OGM56456.1 MAG: hypothetical protein A3F62_02060 [Candidatus Woesebacteria bacterium RIFCSPHIGHO2_12_FULL_44_11]OGM68858.1 MAG: hypothetical protein A2975_00605 [Candidatus Woesebacteria bacterium RIFCSPLOWO2_01_FULL_44_14]